MDEKPLFIPLKAKYYGLFVSGAKTVEYRRYGPRWNEHTCRLGRRVVLSRGYGKAHRITGIIESIHVGEPPDPASWKAVYGDEGGQCISIGIRLPERVTWETGLDPLVKTYEDLGRVTKL